MKFYRKQPIEAEQFDYKKWANMCHEAYPMVFCDIAEDGSVMVTHPFIKTLEGDINISDGDWIATSINNEHWAIADAVFKKTYAELPVIPKYVADYIINGHDVNDLVPIGGGIYRSMIQAVVYGYKEGDIGDWIVNHSDTFARAWLDGYQVEEEK